VGAEDAGTAESKIDGEATIDLGARDQKTSDHGDDHDLRRIS